MKISGIIAHWLFVLCLPLLLFTASIAGAANSLWLYQYGFEKYDISRVTGLSEAELVKAAAGLISYFNSSEADINISVVKDGEAFRLFNQREVAHLRDVKKLFWLDYRVLLGTLIYVLGFTLVRLFWWRDWRQLARVVVAGSSLTLALMLALGLATLLGFDWFFWQFHLLSFANDFWLLDPAHDYLIMLFPRGFWIDAVLFIALAAGGVAIILDLAGIGHLLFNRDSRD